MKAQLHGKRASAARRGYGRRWEKARLLYLAQHPLCVMCQQAGHVAAATHVDHIKSHKGDELLFWDVNNWQGLCTTHHNASKQRQEARGHEGGCSADGVPIDQGHHWNKKHENKR